MATAFALANPLHYHNESFERCESIWQHINIDKFVAHSVDQGFYQFCEHRRLPFRDTHYPHTQAHRAYLDTVMKCKLDACLT